MQQHQAPPFRVLSPGGRIMYEPQAVLRSPPPSRAPEPYKVAPQATSYGRNNRKSAFAIIAETRPPSPLGINGNAGGAGLSRPGSGNINQSGRISPFRGRGFKGPPPGSRSRPLTPTDDDDEIDKRNGRRSRYDRKASISQQNSPRRSQIPRPARSRSISASKENEFNNNNNKSSPKFGRRAANRYTSSVINNNNANRRTAQKDQAKKLSPIQGTPTKFPTDNNRNRTTAPKAAPRNLNNQQQKQASTNKPYNNRNLLAPPKNVLPNNQKRFITAKAPAPRDKSKSSSTEALDSPTKIPLRRGSITNSTPSLSKAQQNKLSTAAATSRDALNKSQSSSGGDKSSPEPFKVISGNGNFTSSKKLNSGSGGPPTDEDLGLVDLLKQSSGATGTSSVVNTTTTTAVQPLQIDAASILAAGESELVAKLTSLEKKQNEENAQRNNSNQTSEQKNDMNNSGAGSGAGGGGGGGAAGGGGNKNGNVTQTMIKHFGPNAGNEDKGLNSNASSNVAQDQAKVTDVTPTVVAQIEKSKDDSMKKPTEDQEKLRQSSSSGHKKSDSKASKSSSKSTGNSSTANDSTKKSPANSAKTDATTDGSNEKKNNSRARKNNGEANSTLRSQLPAVSNESLNSLRSTDTGVSVNTVRGVSSAKEKSGLHMVKRPDEIETLSGNIVHLDRNGDHAISSNTEEVAAAAAAAGTAAATAAVAGNKFQKFKANIKNKLTRGKRGTQKVGTTTNNPDNDRTSASGRKLGACCWPGKMRCLACRRDPKGQLWPGKQARNASTMQLTANTGDKPAGRWARIKNACRCEKLRKIRCCNWRQRRRMQQQVAPSEQTASTCCNPAERRLGGLCRRLFSRCSCSSLSCRRRRQSDDSQNRSRNSKAKHSLTSVAAPPLSEESKPKLPDVLIEHNSVMRGAIPCLPVPLAWFCLMFNVLVPGSGTIFSGIFNLCFGQPRFSATASARSRIGALIIDIVVGVSQLFTVLFCLVGWGWSIWWGVTMIRLARKYKRFKQTEAAANDPEARGPETATLPAPGVPAQALRAVERAR